MRISVFYLIYIELKIDDLLLQLNCTNEQIVSIIIKRGPWSFYDKAIIIKKSVFRSSVSPA